jgi:hypothetical protein
VRHNNINLGRPSNGVLFNFINVQKGSPLYRRPFFITEKGADKMNDFNDIKRIIDEHITAPGRKLTAASMSGSDEVIITAFKDAEKKLAEGLRKLNALKLSKDDRRHIRLLRDCFKTSIKAIQAGKKGNVEKAERLSAEATRLGFEYGTRIMNGADRS